MTEIPHQRNLRQRLRSRPARSIASFIFIVAQIAFWFSFLFEPFSTLSGFMQIRIILYIWQSTLYRSPQLAPSDALFFAYPLGMLLAFGAWTFKIRRGTLLALVSYLGLLSTGFTGDIGFLVCIAMIAVCALTIITE